MPKYLPSSHFFHWDSVIQKLTRITRLQLIKRSSSIRNIQFQKRYYFIFYLFFFPRALHARARHLLASWISISAMGTRSSRIPASVRNFIQLPPLGWESINGIAFQRNPTLRLTKKRKWEIADERYLCICFLRLINDCVSQAACESRWTSGRDAVTVMIQSIAQPVHRFGREIVRIWDRLFEAQK